jgi:hypothetical protein
VLVRGAVDKIAADIAARHASDELFGWKDAGENGPRSGPSARAPGYHPKRKPRASKQGKATTKLSPLAAKHAAAKAAEEEAIAVREAATLEAEKTRIMEGRAAAAAARAARVHRRGSTEGETRNMGKAPTPAPTAINMTIKGKILAAVRARDVHLCFACSIPVVVAARRSRRDGEGSNVAQSELRTDAELSFSEMARVFQYRHTILRRVGAEQWPQTADILGRPANAPTRGQIVLAASGASDENGEGAARATPYTVGMGTGDHGYVRRNDTEDDIFVPCEQWTLHQAKEGRCRAETAREKARSA